MDTTEFTDGNATNSPKGSSAKFFKSMDWNSIFHDRGFASEERDYIINKRQSEVLSLVPVSLEKHLKKIIFRCSADMKRAKIYMEIMKNMK